MPKTTPITQRWERLLEPIGPAAPGGESLRYAGVYDEIREARRQDDANLPQGEWRRELKRADWPRVEELCLNALEHHSKDAQIAVWLLEAELHMHGYTGVKDALKLLLALCEKFWESLWPEWDPNDPELRLAPFVWLNEKLAVPLTLEVALSAPADPSVAAYNYFDLQEALKLEADPDRDTGGRKRVTHTKFLHSAMLTPRPFYAEMLGDVRAALETCASLGRFLDQACGRTAPSLNRFAETLRGIAQAVEGLLKDKPLESAADFADKQAQTAGATAEAGGGGHDAGPGPIRSRAEAYRRLNEAADYLLRTEPHSPTPYLVKRAVSWGKLSLNELLEELVNDEHDLKAIYALLGMRRESE